MSTYCFFKPVSFPDAAAIKFIPYEPCFCCRPFRIISANGKEYDYMGEFTPDDQRSTQCFTCVRNAYAAAKRNPDCPSLINVPIGISRDKRIVAALLKVAFPGTILQDVPDWRNIAHTMETNKPIPLPSAQEADKILAYAPFDEKWYDRHIHWGEMDDEPTPPPEMIP